MYGGCYTNDHSFFAFIKRVLEKKGIKCEALQSILLATIQKHIPRDVILINGIISHPDATAFDKYMYNCLWF